MVFSLSKVKPETPIKRQATQHGCLHRLLVDWDKGIEIVYGEEKKYFALGRLEQPRQNKNLLSRKDKVVCKENQGGSATAVQLVNVLMTL